MQLEKPANNYSHSIKSPNSNFYWQTVNMTETGKYWNTIPEQIVTIYLLDSVAFVSGDCPDV